MQISSNDYRIKRFPEQGSLDDLITSGAVQTGPADYIEVDGQEVLVIPFDPEPTAAEQQAITIRVITADAETEALYRAALNAITRNRAFRAGDGLTVRNEATRLEGEAQLLVNGQANPRDLRLAFSGLRMDNEQVMSLTSQLEEVERLLTIILNRLP